MDDCCNTPNIYGSSNEPDDEFTRIYDTSRTSYIALDNNTIDLIATNVNINGSSVVVDGASSLNLTNSEDNDTPPRVSFNKDRVGNAVQANDVLGVFNFFGQTDTGSVNTGVVASVANENFTSTAYGTSLVVTTTESGTSNTALRLLINDTVMQVNPPLSLTRDITQIQQTTPSNPAPLANKLYFKNDDQLYRLNSTGTESKVGDNFDTLNIVNNVSDFSESTLNISKTRAGGQLLSNDVLGRVQFKGQTDTTLVNGGSISASANQIFASGSHGTSITISTVTNNTGAEAVRMFINGGAVIVNPPLELSSEIVQTQQTKPPAPLSGTNKLYFASDNNLYTQDSTGLEQRLSTDTLNLDKLQLNTQTLDITSVSGLSALTSKHVGGILAPNGKIYFIPDSQDFITVVDSRDLSTYTITGVPVLSQGFNGGCITPSGLIYCIPRSATYVLIINTNNDTIDGTSITGLSADLSKYAGGSLAPNGKIYCTPLNATNILIINTNNNTTSLIDTASVPGGLAGSTKWESSVLAPNGLIYCIPFTATTVLVINPATDSADNTLITGLPVGSKCIGGCLSSNGRIYCCPFATTTVFIIDPATNLVDSTSITGVSSSNAGCVLANDGKIYCAPFSSTSVLIIDPADNSFNNTNITGVTGATKYNGANVDNLGRVYFSPVSATNVGIITTHGLQTVTPDRYSSRYYNKY